LRPVKSSQAIHAPDDVLGRKEVVEKLGYVCKIVPHESSRKRAIDAFKIALSSDDVDEGSGEEEGDYGGNKGKKTAAAKQSAAAKKKQKSK
jgi:hypothetical protein